MCRRVMLSSKVLFSLMVSIGLAAGACPRSASAEIEKLTIVSARDIGPFAGKPYREIEAKLHGTAPGGPYEAPVTLAFPTKAADFDGFTVVDIVNTVTLFMEGFKPAGGALPMARVHMGDEFLFGRGSGYVAVIWDDAAVKLLDKGAIESRTDGYTVIRDAATLARNPSRHLPATAGVEAPDEARTIAYGFSQTGGLVRGWFFDGHNSEGEARAFDGGIPAGAGGWCTDLAIEDGKSCAGPVSDGAKVIALLPEGDVAWGGVEERGESPDYRVIDIAGVSHIPSTAADFRQLGMPEQNPVGFEPVVRAALVNLEEWLDGREPPPSIAIDISAEPGGTLMGAPLSNLVRDGDGNAVGGLRLPHMPSRLADGTRAGAPLGAYAGLALDRQEENFYFAISGVFAPFPPEKLAALYPDHAAYVAAVTAAAEDLASRRYILPEDAAAYIAAAKSADIGRP